MEAEVGLLNPQIMTEVDYNCNTIHPELEVKKLQALVRSLEAQNAQLRTRAHGCTGGSTGGCTGGHALSGALILRGGARCCLPGACRASLGSFHTQDEALHTHVSAYGGQGEEEDDDDDDDDEEERTVLGDVELLDLDSLFSDESDESWLYVSSHTALCVGRSPSPLQWCRSVLDSPKARETRRAVSLHLQQASRWCQYFPASSSSSSLIPPLGCGAGVSPICSTPSPTTTRLTSTLQRSQRPASPLASPLNPSLRRLPSPLLTDPPPLAERSPTFLRHLASHGLGAWPVAEGDLGDAEELRDSIAMGYKLHDLTDVQVMARLQEESLRQDYASTAPRLRTRRRLAFQSPGRCPAASPPEEEAHDLLPPARPRLACLPHSHTFSSVREWWQRGASPCTPPAMPCTPPATPCTPPATPSTPPCASGPFSFQLPLPPGRNSPGTAQLQGFRAGSVTPGSRSGTDFENKLWRSMPTLARAPSMPSVPTTANQRAPLSLLRNSQSFDSSAGLAQLYSSIPSPGQLQNRVPSVGNFSSLSRQPLKATAYVSPTIKGPAAVATTTTASPCGPRPPSGIPTLGKAGPATPASSPATARSSLPRPASLVGTPSPSPRAKVGRPARSLMTPPKALSTLGVLRHAAWKDGCY